MDGQPFPSLACTNIIRGGQMKLQIDNRAPVYVQVIQYFKEQIANGNLEKGEEIPSRRELASMLKINPNTVQRAYKEMESAGLIYTDGNMPSKITRDDTVIKEVHNELLTEALHTFASTLHTLQVPLDDIIPLLRNTYDQVGRESS